MEKHAKARPRIIAHRGAMAHAPQNTITAFELALDHKADALEFDIQLSKDKVPVVFHDQTLKALTGEKGTVSTHTAANLQAMNAAHAHSGQYTGTGIPLLATVLEQFAHRALLNIEIKSANIHKLGYFAYTAMTGYRHTLSQRSIQKWQNQNAELIEAVVATLKSFASYSPPKQIYDRILISSFDPILLEQLQKQLPQLRLALLEGPSCALAHTHSHNSQYQAWHPDRAWCNKKTVEKQQQANKLVNVWTVNKIADIQRMTNLGVNGIITNNPELVHQELARQKQDLSPSTSWAILTQ